LTGTSASAFWPKRDNAGFVSPDDGDGGELFHGNVNRYIVELASDATSHEC
jgi:hypothetical protein